MVKDVNFLCSLAALLNVQLEIISCLSFSSIYTYTYVLQYTVHIPTYKKYTYIQYIPTSRFGICDPIVAQRRPLWRPGARVL